MDGGGIVALALSGLTPLVVRDLSTNLNGLGTEIRIRFDPQKFPTPVTQEDTPVGNDGETLREEYSSVVV